MSTRTFEFKTLLADSRAVVTVSCEYEHNYGVISFNTVLYEGFNVYDVLSDNQWENLEIDAEKAYDAEYLEQQTIDYELDAL